MPKTKALVKVGTERSGLPAPLTAAERTRYAELKSIIRDNLIGFYAVGMALMEIRGPFSGAGRPPKGTGLWREESYETFEDFCSGEFGYARQTANQVMAAARVQEQMTAIAVILPNEGTARELTGLLDQPKILAKVGKVLAGKDKVTAAIARAAVDAALPAQVRIKVTKEQGPEATDAQILLLATEALKDVRLALLELKNRKYNVVKAQTALKALTHSLPKAR